MSKRLSCCNAVSYCCLNCADIDCSVNFLLKFMAKGFCRSREVKLSKNSLNPVTEVEWAPAYQSWLTISRLRMGASALLGKGIVYIDCDNTAAPAIA